MELVGQSVELKRVPSFDWLLSERMFRECYGSTDRITGLVEDAKAFILRLGNMNHNGALQSVCVYFKTDYGMYPEITDNPFSIKTSDGIQQFVYTNLDVIKNVNKELYNIIIESPAGQEKDVLYSKSIKLLSLPGGPFECIHARFTTSRAVADEIARYRQAVHAMKSTRYCNFNNLRIVSSGFEIFDNYLTIIGEAAEECYRGAKNNGFKKDCLRQLLPIQMETILGTVMRRNGWNHFVEQRTAAGAHYQIRELAEDVKVFLEK